MHGRTDKPTRKEDRIVQGPSIVCLEGLCVSQTCICAGTREPRAMSEMRCATGDAGIAQPHNINFRRRLYKSVRLTDWLTTQNGTTDFSVGVWLEWKEIAALCSNDDISRWMTWWFQGHGGGKSSLCWNDQGDKLFRRSSPRNIYTYSNHFQFKQGDDFRTEFSADKPRDVPSPTRDRDSWPS